MKWYAIAAAAAAFAGAFLLASPSDACPKGNCGGAAAASSKPLQLTGQARAKRTVAKETKRKRTRAARKAPVKMKVPAAAQAAETPQVAEEARDAPLPVIVVRTTRETSDENVEVVSAEELNEIDRAVVSQSLVTSTIANYLGVSAISDAFDDVPAAVSSENFPEDAKEAFAALPEPPKQSEVAIEYILMTFGGALAAAAALRVFAV